MTALTNYLECTTDINYQVRVGLASGWSAFNYQVTHSPEYESAANTEHTEGSANELTNHLAALVTSDYDSNYRHPNDIAMALTICLASELGIIVSKIIVESIRSMNNLFWSRQALDRTQVQIRIHSQAASQSLVSVNAYTSSSQSNDQTTSLSQTEGQVRFFLPSAAIDLTLRGSTQVHEPQQIRTQPTAKVVTAEKLPKGTASD